MLAFKDGSGAIEVDVEAGSTSKRSQVLIAVRKQREQILTF
jgi:hypothetical protein